MGADVQTDRNVSRDQLQGGGKVPTDLRIILDDAEMGDSARYVGETRQVSLPRIRRVTRMKNDLTR